MTYIEALQDAIHNLHGCWSIHLESVPVRETFEGQTVWDGTVEVFELKGHPKAKKCYAWGQASAENDHGVRYLAVLEIPPVISPSAAVRAAITHEFRQSHKEGG